MSKVVIYCPECGTQNVLPLQPVSQASEVTCSACGSEIPKQSVHDVMSLAQKNECASKKKTSVGDNNMRTLDKSWLRDVLDGTGYAIKKDKDGDCSLTLHDGDVFEHDVVIYFSLISLHDGIVFLNLLGLSTGFLPKEDYHDALLFCNRWRTLFSHPKLDMDDGCFKLHVSFPVQVTMPNRYVSALLTYYIGDIWSFYTHYRAEFPLK